MKRRRRVQMPAECWVIGLTALLAAGPFPPQALAKESSADIRSILSQYCFECHGNDLAEGRIDLEEMSGNSDFGRRFKDWEKVDRVLRERKMPPEKMPQPSDPERKAVVQTVSSELNRFIEQHAGRPGASRRSGGSRAQSTRILSRT